MRRPAPAPISEAEKLACVMREIGLRKSVYPRLVRAGKMTHDTADYEIKVMEAIAADYRARAHAEAGQGSLL